MMLYSFLGDYRSLSGARISRGRAVRLVYLDEAGISSPNQEPYMVVSGVILNGDQDWHPIERHLKALVRKHIPEGDRWDFIFHATEIWSGAKYFKGWPFERRRKILADLAEIPSKFHLTVVSGYVHRPSAMAAIKNRFPKMKDRVVANLIHADAFVSVACAVDEWMRRHAPQEAAMIIAEKTGRVQEALKMLQEGFSVDMIDEFWLEQEGPPMPRAFRTTRIIDTVHFAGKDESAPLQVADTCAFFVKHRLAQRRDSAEFFDRFSRQLYPTPKPVKGWLTPAQFIVRKPLRLKVLKENTEIVEE